MTARQLYEFAERHGFEDLELVYPRYETEDDLAKVTLAKTLVTSFEDKEQIILLSI